MKYTPEKIKHFCELYHKGYTYREIEAMMNVSTSAVHYMFRLAIEKEGKRPMNQGKKKYSEAQINQFRALYDAGQSRKYIGAQMGLSERKVHYFYQHYIDEKRDFNPSYMGERSNRAKLTDVEVISIFADLDAGLEVREIAERLDVTAGHIRGILEGDARKDNPKINELRNLYKIRLRNKNKK